MLSSGPPLCTACAIAAPRSLSARFEARPSMAGCKKDLVEDGSWPVEAGSRPFRGRARAGLRRATLGQLLCERVRLEEGNLFEPIARLQPELTQVGRPQRDAVERG